MRKKGALYRVNRFNKGGFMPEENLFDWGGLAQADYQKNPWNYVQDSSITEQYMNSKNAFGISKKNNPFSKGNMAGVGKAAFNGLMTGAADVVGGIGAKAISGGLESGAGSAISGIGSSVAGAVGMVNPVAGAIIGVGSQLLGGLTNRAFGSKINEENVNSIKQSNAAMRAAGNAVGSATTNEEVLSNWGNVDLGTDFNNSYIGKDGWFSNKAKKKAEKLRAQQESARAFASHALATGAENADQIMDDNVMANFVAFGGPIDTNSMSAINYSFMSDYLTNKKKLEDNKNQMTNMFMGTPSTMFDLGGDIQMNGGDFSTGLTHIDAGGSHELNPNDGVQMGVDHEGTPNLVEEGETVFNDYVFSNRILADEATKKLFHLPKKKDITFADISKKLEKEISERPNDPISEAGFKAQMQTLEEQQERQKQKMEAERAKAAFEALSPEEQTAVMQRMAQEEAMAQQAAQAQAQQPTPEEMQMMQQQQMMQADGSQAALGQEPQQFAEGGDMKKRLYKLLGINTDSEYKAWLKKNNLDDLKDAEDFDNILNNEAIIKAATKDNPALADAISRGYDFGVYKPLDNGKATIKSISKGNWKATNGLGWIGSDDPAWTEAVKGMSDEDIKKLSTEDVARLMRATDSYKKGSEWLQNKNNALLYLNTLMNDPDTPQVAKDYAAKFVKDGQWKDGFDYDYATVFGSNGKGVRETNPGTYWHTPVEATRGNMAKNMVINPDGTVEEIVGDVPIDWTAAGNYAWQTPENNLTYNYYQRPVVTSNGEVVTTSSPQTPPAEVDNKGVAPKRKDDWMRYAGLFGPAVGLGMQMAGIGRPDYSRLDAAVDRAGDVHLASMKPLGNYLTYRPMDIWYEQNRLNANSRATDRAILNSGANQGSKMAGLLASGYNDQIASGDLYRKALEYNDAKRAQVAEFNRGTDQFNADAFNRLSQFNASARNQATQQRASLALQAAKERMDADAGWYNSLYGNVSGLFKGLSDLGRENAQHNMIAQMWADGLAGTATPDTYTASDYLKWQKRAAKGGDIKRKKGKKRGLTF